MGLRNTATEWGSVTKLLHWSIALLLLAQGGMGLLMGELPREARMTVVDLHKSVGVLILVLVTLRFAWFFLGGRTAAAPGVTTLQARLAKLVHLVLYALLFAVPISGWLMVNYGGRPLSFFGLFALPPLVGANEALQEVYEGRHETLFWVLMLLVLGHAAMAIIHHVLLRDATLVRMLPGKRSPPAPLDRR